jgi:excisionase family DNA binding protein
MGGLLYVGPLYREELAVEALLTRKELSNLLQVPTSTLNQWASQGKGPVYLIVGRHSRYRRQDVERWLDDQARLAEAGGRS